MRVLAGLALVLAADRASAADTRLGRDVAATCSSCHGAGGRGQGAMPDLAGGEASALVRRMKEFREGRRPATLMGQIAKGYTDAEIEAAAAYFAAQRPK